MNLKPGSNGYEINVFEHLATLNIPINGWNKPGKY